VSTPRAARGGGAFSTRGAGAEPLVSPASSHARASLGSDERRGATRRLSRLQVHLRACDRAPAREHAAPWPEGAGAAGRPRVSAEAAGLQRHGDRGAQASAGPAGRSRGGPGLEDAEAGAGGGAGLAKVAGGAGGDGAAAGGAGAAAARALARAAALRRGVRALAGGRAAAGGHRWGGGERGDGLGGGGGARGSAGARPCVVGA
jgi:hypothetical protein